MNDTMTRNERDKSDDNRSRRCQKGVPRVRAPRRSSTYSWIVSDRLLSESFENHWTRSIRGIHPLPFLLSPDTLTTGTAISTVNRDFQGGLPCRSPNWSPFEAPDKDFDRIEQFHGKNFPRWVYNKAAPGHFIFGKHYSGHAVDKGQLNVRNRAFRSGVDGIPVQRCPRGGRSWAEFSRWFLPIQA